MASSGSTSHPVARTRRPTLAVWKFASCDGCQLTLLNCEDELIPIAGAIDIAYFPEATRAVVDGPYDLSLVEGSITTPEELDRIQQVRSMSRRLITIGACATSGGIQALRNFADVAEFRSVVYAHPEYVETLSRATPISAHVAVDMELRGCPIDKGQLLEVLAAELQGRKPRDTDVLGLRGVQAPRQRVRHGRARDSLPRPGHPGRLWRAVPELRPRLLRLLRAPGQPQHHVPVRTADRPGHAPSRRAARLSHVQRRERCLRGRERTS